MRIFARRFFQSAPAPQPEPQPPYEPDPRAEEDGYEDDYDDITMRVRRSDVPAARGVEQVVRTAPASMWDGLEDEDDADGVQTALPLPTRSPVGRAKTRLLGQQETTDFGSDVFEDSAPAQKAIGVRFPVGFLIVVGGPGRGTAFTLQAGVSQIGRGDDETIPLNFGDTAISRHNHASVAYDAETHDYYIGHGGKLNMVRLNGRPVLSTEPLHDGDHIRIGETTLKFMALCSKEFNWSEAMAEQEPTGRF